MSVKFIAKVFLLALLGAIVSTICDANHAYTSALVYTYPVVLGQAWWVLPNFIICFFVMTLGYYFLSTILPVSVKSTTSFSEGYMQPFLDSVIIFVFVYLLTGFAHREPNLLSVILYGTFILRVFIAYERLFIFVIAIILACSGILVEGSIAMLGHMEYSHPFIYHVPLWLGALYMHGSFCLRESFRYMVVKN